MMNESTALHEKITEGERSSEIMSKLAATQNVMKKKFRKAIANRLEQEYNLKETMEPLRELSFTSSSSLKDSELPKENVSLRNLSKTKNMIQQLRLATKSYSNPSIKSRPMLTKSITKKLADSDNEWKKIENTISNNDSGNVVRIDFDNPNELCDRFTTTNCADCEKWESNGGDKYDYCKTL